MRTNDIILNMQKITVEDFEWDEGNRKKCQSHGLSLDEIEQFFHQDKLFVSPDFKHSQKEERFLAMGRSINGRPMFVVFALRKSEGRQFIRPISARYMHEKEAKQYEEKNA